MDTVQFKKDDFQHRNKIRNKEGWTWLTVPLQKHSFDTLIKDIKISYDHPWQKKHLNLLKANYQSAPFFKDYFPKLEEIINSEHEFLADLNIRLIHFLLESFGIFGKKILRASELDLPEVRGGTRVNLEISKKINAHTYISGPAGKEYLDLAEFEKAGIKVLFHEFEHPVYSQIHGEFLPYMSAVDALFNMGPDFFKKI